MNPSSVNPADLDALLAVLRKHNVAGFEYTTPEGGRVILQLAPALEAAGSPSLQVYDERGPGAWK